VVSADVALPSVDVAPFTLLVPVVGIFTAWLVRGEHPTWGELLGSLVVLVGLGLALGLVDTVAIRRRCAALGNDVAAPDRGRHRPNPHRSRGTRLAIAPLELARKAGSDHEPALPTDRFQGPDGALSSPQGANAP
jgi:hypothetical protein